MRLTFKSVDSERGAVPSRWGRASPSQLKAELTDVYWRPRARGSSAGSQPSSALPLPHDPPGSLPVTHTTDLDLPASIILSQFLTVNHK